MTTIAGVVSSTTITSVRNVVKILMIVGAGMINLYTCMSCDKKSPDHTLFKMVRTEKIAFVVCLECLRTW